MFDGYVLGVQVDEAVGDAFEPCVNIRPGEVGVAGVEIDADGGRIDEVVNSVEAFGGFGILGVAFQTYFDAPALGDEGGLLQRIFHQDEILFFGCPLGLDAFIGIDNGHANLGGDSDGELYILAVDFRSAERPVCLEAGDLEAGLP